MSPLRRLLLGLLVVLLSGGAGVAWMSRHSFRRVPQSLEVGLRGEALENPTLLFQKWLEAGGRAVRRQGGTLRAQDLPEGGVLVLVHLSLPLSPAEVDTLRAWVGRGGHLLTDGSVAPFNDERGLAALHGALGVSLLDPASEHEGPGPSRGGVDTDTFVEGEPSYHVRRASWRLIPKEVGAWSLALGYEGRQVLLTRPEGRGRITLTPDLSFLHRRALADLDHASYAQRLLDLQPGRGPVVVWSLPADRGLFSWLWAHAKAPALALLLLVGAWVWKGWPRFGPLRPEPQPRRRSMLEHVRASARLMWWGGAEPHLIARTREALERRAQRVNPAFEALDLGGRAQWLAQATGGHADAIQAALDERPGRSSHQLAQDLLLLERLRQRL